MTSMFGRPVIRGKRVAKDSSVIVSSTETTNNFIPVDGVDKINKNGTQIQIRVKLFHLCAMPLYENKSIEEHRFEYYERNRKSSLRTIQYSPSPSNASSSFGVSTINDISTRYPFGSNTVTTFSTSPVMNTHFNSFVPTTACLPSTPLFTVAQDFALAVKELNDCMRELNKHKTATDQEQTSLQNKFIPHPSSEIICCCTDCQKAPQMQCLHCSKQVCIDCAQKHVELSNQQIEAAKQVLANKINVLDRLVVAAKERVKIEREKIIQQADTERDRAFIQIDELYEQQKKQLQDKSTEMHQLGLDKISSYIQRMTNEIEDLNEDNEQLFCVIGTPGKIQVQHNH